MEIHPYAFTMTGRCGHCGLDETQHPVLLPRPDPLTECLVDHRSINTSFRVGENGGQWNHCPSCGVMVEGALAKGVLEGRPDGKGRGVITVRQERQLTFVGIRNAGLL